MGPQDRIPGQGRGHVRHRSAHLGKLFAARAKARKSIFGSTLKNGHLKNSKTIY